MSNITSMRNIKDFYVLGLPIETHIGNISFIKVKDFPNYYEALGFVKMTKDHIVKMFYENGMEGEDLDLLKSSTLREVVLAISEIGAYYHKIISHLCDESIDMMTWSEEEFEIIRKIILDTSVLKEEKINSNPELQAWLEKSKSYKASSGDTLEFQDIVTSVAVATGYTFQEINEMTVFQLYSQFYRIAQFKSYDTTSLFATVAEDINVESWSKNIDILKDEESSHSREDFNKMTGNIF